MLLNEAKLGSFEKGGVIFQLFGKEYQLYGDRVISDGEASQIYEKLLAENSQSIGDKKTTA